LIQTIELSTGVKVPDGVDATERLNRLINDPNFGERLLEMSKNNELEASLDFAVQEFKGPLTPEALIKAIQTGRRNRKAVTTAVDGEHKSGCSLNSCTKLPRQNQAAQLRDLNVGIPFTKQGATYVDARENRRKSEELIKLRSVSGDQAV
jgi:hypothetical protein